MEVFLLLIRLQIDSEAFEGGMDLFHTGTVLDYVCETCLYSRQFVLWARACIVRLKNNSLKMYQIIGYYPIL